MIKRTLCFSSPGRLRLHLRQLIWQGEGEGAREASIPIEDIGLIIIEFPLISISAARHAISEGLLLDGFSIFQFSVYLRHCASRENAAVHIQRVRKIVPPEGMVSILSLTDKQFGQIIICYGAKEKPPPPPPPQLELF